jgi:hypothetical protein
LSAIHSNRNDGDLASQSSDDLKSHPIFRIVEATLALIIASVEPARSDECENNLAFGKTLFKSRRKIGPGTHVNINEDIFATEFACKIL